MKTGDKVKLMDRPANRASVFWRDRKVDFNSVGTVVDIPLPLLKGVIHVEVVWDNGSKSITNVKYLKVWEDENIPLPNLKFKRKVI